eukprot:1176038-Prorocentrum_minimum.AAC.4
MGGGREGVGRRSEGGRCHQPTNQPYHMRVNERVGSRGFHAHKESIVSLPHCLPHRVTASPCHCLTVSLPHCLTVYLTVALPHCARRPDAELRTAAHVAVCLTVSLPHCVTAALCHCARRPGAELRAAAHVAVCLTVSLPHCLTVS